jgi:hypothetical protein
MKTLRYLVLLTCVAIAAYAKTKEFTISGGGKIKAEFQHGMPLPAEKGGIKIEAAAFMFGDNKLTFAFGFTTTKKLQKVVVEDVTASVATTLVEDRTPTLDEAYWKGEASPLAISKSTVPWLYERGDTTKVFRFTVTLAGEVQPVVLYQPSVYSNGTKAQLLQIMVR